MQRDPVAETCCTSQTDCVGHMRGQSRKSALRTTTLAALLLCAVVPLLAAMKNWAVVVAAGSKLQDVSLADLSKYCRGAQKAWPDGRIFTLVVRNPESPEMRTAMEKLFGGGGSEKSAPTKQGESRPILRIVDTDEDLIRAVGSTPGAVGLVDVYSINSSVKVLRVDGKLPFDPGYSLKLN